jgi:hypothetical protein
MRSEAAAAAAASAQEEIILLSVEGNDECNRIVCLLFVLSSHGTARQHMAGTLVIIAS